MPATVIVGLQWGDEGKGKIVDYVGDDFDLFVRFQGGNNAGHTVIVDNEKFALHFIPSGVVRGKKVAIGNGCVVNPESLLAEIKELEDRGLDVDLVLSERAHVILPEHIELDKQEGKAIGTTGRGIGVAYTQKIARKGVTFAEYVKKHPELKKYVGDVSLLVNEFLDQNKNVLLEGAQGAMLDIDHGTYPFVTSSSTIAGGACIGAGVSPRRIDKVIGVTKAYTTRVGNGPFPTELNDRIGNFIREKGKEFGTTTGRPRRCGWFDSVVVRRSAMLNGVDEIVVTKLDVLTGLEKVKICESYEFDGKEIIHFPAGLSDDFKPNYVELEGWSDEISAVKEKDDLPVATVSYLNAFAKSLGNPRISMIGVGPERNQIVEV